VFVDGQKVVDTYRVTTLDEEQLYQEAQKAAQRIVDRSGLPNKAKWPTI
jgi:hypothetical protein